MNFKKRFVTLMEMMIVMFLIALITGVVAYNYRGTLEKGKAFKTEQGMQRVETILSLHVAEEPDSLQDLEREWQSVIRRDPSVKDAESLIKDGWGVPYQVSVRDNVIEVNSANYEEYVKSNKGKRK